MLTDTRCPARQPLRHSLTILLPAALAALAALLTVGAAQKPCAPHAPPTPPALASLVAAERAFARLSVVQGVRAAFIATFAADGINFTPHPTKTQEAFRRRPAPATLPPITLDWFPVYADISQAGDLGYTTGPYTVTDHAPQPQPTRHGYYFSIWRKQPRGQWRVVLDLGIQTPAPDAAPTFHAPRTIGGERPRGPVQPAGARAALLAADRALLQAEATRGLARALPAVMTEDARLHRNELFPVVTRRAIAAYLTGRRLTVTGAPIAADVARSGDLGYTYGSYEQHDGPAKERGYYVRLWKRVGGRWRVALDTTNPVPPESN